MMIRTIPSRIAAIGALIALVGVSCSDSTTEAENEQPAASTTTPALRLAEPSDGVLISDAEELVGTYGHFDVVAYENDEMKTLIISFGISTLELKDGELWTTQRFCHADQASDQPIETSLSDAATQAIIPISTPVEVTGEPGDFRVQRPPTPTPVGIKLDDPENEKLPTDPNDPRISDDDGDGNPGITVKVKFSEDFEGEIYLARREIFAYDLTQTNDGTGNLAGSVVDSSEQLVIGASTDLLLASAQWEQLPDPDLSPIVWTPIEAGTSCDELMAMRDDLFEPNPTVNW